MNIVVVTILVYIIIVVVVCIQVLLSTKDSGKALAYLMLVIFIPVIGISFYFLFGLNYWKKRKYKNKISQNKNILDQVKTGIVDYDKSAILDSDHPMAEHIELSSMLVRDLGSPLTKGNKVKLLNNGEEKFPELIQAIEEAKHHIHLQYYIYRYDKIGTTIIELLIEKAKAGVKVRLIYDDFGSPSIDKETKKRMQDAGAAVYPFHKVNFYLFANRFNYRNHRKIVIIDGRTAFIGGINVSDSYINNGKNKLYWRDSHLRLDGPAVYYLQYLFMTDWKFCCSEAIKIEDLYFKSASNDGDDNFVQIVAGGPDSVLPTVLYSILQLIYISKREILITTPYFIPGDSCIDALCVSALSGLSVKLLVPEKGDSNIVAAASRSYYAKLLNAGVEIYHYQKGFIHSKTIVTDSQTTMIGTANMDNRSFELNFEVNAIIYNDKIAKDMRSIFFDDLKNAVKVDKQAWLSRSRYRQLPEKVAGLFSPVL
ncbi:MAG: cardiolipin synthase 2 [Cyclobacteriaceae bacterium]|nr:MAG: cardiolipin synthase 2 [Cyclobacteriaceae bacterium]